MASSLIGGMIANGMNAQDQIGFLVADNLHFPGIGPDRRDQSGGRWRDRGRALARNERTSSDEVSEMSAVTRRRNGGDAEHCRCFR